MYINTVFNKELCVSYVYDTRIHRTFQTKLLVWTVTTQITAYTDSDNIRKPEVCGKKQKQKQKMDKWDFFLHFVRSLGKNPAGSHCLKWYDEYCLFLERCNKITLFCKVQNPKIAWGYYFSSLIYNKPSLSPLVHS